MVMQNDTECEGNEAGRETRTAVTSGPKWPYTHPKVKKYVFWKVTPNLHYFWTCNELEKKTTPKAYSQNQNEMTVTLSHRNP